MSAVPTPLIAGPTAGGKSEVALRVAQRLGAEVVSADSQQVYRGLDIGTAKPTAAERAMVRHHLVDVVDPTEQFNAARFREMALSALTEIRARGGTPLVVGGTGLYLAALTEELSLGVGADPSIRARVEERIREVGAPELWAELNRVAPEVAARIRPNDPVRIVRAIELRELTGSARAQRQPAPLRRRLFVLAPERSRLHQRIAERTRAMLQHGLFDEVRELLRVYPADAPAFRGIGYRECVAVVKGEMKARDLEEAIVVRTRGLARRQLTWFRARADATWLDPATVDAAGLIATDVERTCSR
ncbi:MAG: tRNA (adenosine(37)-N6)-dimethylallyltransferase MiaA [Candidatus Dormibacteria bacterium]